MKQAKRIFSVWLSLMLLIGVMSVASSAATITIPLINDGKHMNFRDGTGTIGVWWWNASDARNETTREKYLQFLYDNQVTEIYLSAGGMSHAQIATFIRAAAQKDIRVAWLVGDASWINSKDLSCVTAYKNYQNSAAEGEKFYALHLDVEPHQIGATAGNFQKYAEYVQLVNNELHASGEKAEWDVIFWANQFNVTIDGQSWNLTDYMASTSDTITIMSYRDSYNGVWSVSSAWIKSCKTYGCKVVCGVETYSREGNQVSFMEEGKIPMYNALKSVYRALAGEGLEGGYGITIHHMPVWYNLKEGEGTVEEEEPVQAEISDPDPNARFADANGDGQVNGQDIIRLRKYYSGLDYTTMQSTVSIVYADANGDGVVNLQDLIRIKKYLANYDYTTNTSTVVLGQ